MCIIYTQYSIKIIIKSIKIEKFFINIFILSFFVDFWRFYMKKFNDNRNVIGNLIKEHREKSTTLKWNYLES